MGVLRNGLITQNYTEVRHEDDYKFNAPHHFRVVEVVHGKEVCAVDFQEGPIKECGVNGAANEDLIAMVIKRLECFQESQYASNDNAVAITKLQEALMWLRKRTLEREARAVEGTSAV